MNRTVALSQHLPSISHIVVVASFVLAFLFAPFSTKADFEVVLGLAADHAGAYVVEDVSFDQSEMSVIVGDELTEATSEWTVHFLLPFDDEVPEARAAFMLGKYTEDGSVDADLYTIVHAHIPETGEVGVSFPELILKDSSNPSGVYTLQVYVYPETKTVENTDPVCYDWDYWDSVDYEGYDETCFPQAPYTEQDFLDWFQWNILTNQDTYEGEIPETYSPDGFRQLNFDYTAVTYVEPSEPDPVIVIPGILGSRIKHGVWTLDPVLHAYDNLVETLVGNGYVYDQTIFTFPYNWTQSNEITAEELKEKIDEVKVQTGANSVDLVAHSMGGLVARQYIQSPEYEGDVDQLIFLGTPQLGAPLAYLMYEGGESDRTTLGYFFGLYLDHLAHEAGFDNPFDYIHLGNVESVRQLLPIYDYLFNNTNQLLDYPNGYPMNPFLENLKATADQLSTNGVKVINIIGNNEQDNTLNSLNVEPSVELPLWLHGVPVSFNRGEGDQTVPVVSAAPSFINSSITLASDHTSLPTEAEGLVYSILTGETATFLANVPLIERFLVLRAFSPVDIQIIAPSGARIGKDFDTGQEFDEIPGAFYSGFDTNVEYVVIPKPEDGQYIINVQGIGAGGSYTLSTGYIDGAESFQTNVTSAIVDGATTQVIATLDTVSDEPVIVEQSLNDLIAHLKMVINDLGVSDKQKNKLLKKVERVEKKIEKQIIKQSKVLDKLNTQIQRKADKGKIDADAAGDVSALLDDLIENSAMVPLDQEMLTDLKDQINVLGVKQKLQKSLLKKVQWLENLATLNRSITKMIRVVERKENKGKLSEDDAGNVLNVLEQIQEAL